MTPISPWTVAVADGRDLRHPSIAYVIDADDHVDAVVRVHAHHSSVTGGSAEQILVVAADPGVPPADAWYGWTDLRGVQALRLVLEPAQVRELAGLRLRLRRWTAMTAPSHAADDPDAAPISPPAWPDTEAEAICRVVDRLLRAVGR